MRTMTDAEYLELDLWYAALVEVCADVMTYGNEFSEDEAFFYLWKDCLLDEMVVQPKARGNA